MFDMGWDEMLLIGVVSLVVIGPKDLPKVLRQAGIWARRARDMAGEFHRGIDQMVKEAELAELKKDVEHAADTSNFRYELEQAARIEPPNVTPPVAEVPITPSVPPAP